MKNIVVINKYCTTKNSYVDTVITDINDVELSTDSDSSNEEYNINNYFQIVNSNPNPG